MTPNRIDLPHRHPFRFVATGEQGSSEDVRWDQVRVRLTHGGPWGRLRDGCFPDFFAIELMAQACAVILAADPNGPATVPTKLGLLAGVSDFQLESPLRVGDTLVAEAQRQGTFGALTKVQATLSRNQTIVARAGLLLSSEGIG
ncbi:MAG: hypothetical protein K8J08_15270 [Thermoanaerobaculia bacterium]|nr:hypothetical protein [Thermoanaerobaculia bacterium]